MFFSARVKKVSFWRTIAWLLWVSLLSIQQLIYIDGVVKRKKEGEYKSNDALTNDEDPLITKLSIAAYQVATGVVEYHHRRSLWNAPTEFSCVVKLLDLSGFDSINHFWNIQLAMHCNSFGHACYSNWQPLSLFKLWKSIFWFLRKYSSITGVYRISFFNTHCGPSSLLYWSSDSGPITKYA